MHLSKYVKFEPKSIMMREPISLDPSLDFTEDIKELKNKNKELESRVKFLEEKIEHMELDFLIKLNSLLHE